MRCIFFISVLLCRQKGLVIMNKLFKILLVIICIGFISAFVRGIVYHKEANNNSSMDKIQIQNN